MMSIVSRQTGPYIPDLLKASVSRYIDLQTIRGQLSKRCYRFIILPYPSLLPAVLLLSCYCLRPRPFIPNPRLESKLGLAVPAVVDYNDRDNRVLRNRILSDMFTGADGLCFRL